MTTKKVRVLISPAGEVRTIHSDDFTPRLRQLGKVTVRRATHVEVYADLSIEAKAYLRDIRQLDYAACTATDPWFADMSAVCTPDEYKSGGAVLGPFPTRDAALAAEVDALWSQHCPVAG